MNAKRSSEEKIYRFICEHPGNCTYDISRKLSMSGGKVRNALQRLEGKGLVRFKFVRSSHRMKKLSYPVGMWDLLPKPLLKILPGIRN